MPDCRACITFQAQNMFLTYLRPQQKWFMQVQQLQGDVESLQQQVHGLKDEKKKAQETHNAMIMERQVSNMSFWLFSRLMLTNN